MAETLLELRGLSKAYAGTLALEPVDLEVARGEYLVLLGPSGSGKTTLLSLLGGFVEPSAGRVRIGGVDVTELPPARRPTATVFQDYALFPHMNVRANVAFGLAMRGQGRAEREAQAERMLDLVGLTGLGGRGIHQLSGGQRQRVALARALAVAPEVLLLDEPLGALDLALRRQMQEELVRVHQSLGTTFVHVTHDQEEALRIAERIVVMSQGRIQDVGSPERVYLRPANRFTATFMGENNLLPAQITAVQGAQVRVRCSLGELSLAGEGTPGERIELAIRPEQWLLLPAPVDAVPLGTGLVEQSVFQGTHLRLQVRPEAEPERLLGVRVPVDRATRAGTRVTLGVRPQDVVVLRG